jgi:hypothetical protein
MCLGIFFLFFLGTEHSLRICRKARSTILPSQQQVAVSGGEKRYVGAGLVGEGAARGSAGKGTVVSMAMGRESTIVKRREKKKRGLAQQCMALDYEREVCLLFGTSQWRPGTCTVLQCTLLGSRTNTSSALTGLNC